MVYRTKGTCSREIQIDTQGISSLVKGMKIQEVIDKTEGIDCGGRGTSCPDQLSKALKQILADQNGGK